VATGARCPLYRRSRQPRPQSGGPYAYVETAFGPYADIWTGVLLWLGITLAMGAVSTVFADAVAGLGPGLGGPLRAPVLLIAVIAGLAAVNIRGAALGAHLRASRRSRKSSRSSAFVVFGLSHVRAEISRWDPSPRSPVWENPGCS